MPSLYDRLKFVVTDSSEKFLSGSQLVIAILIQILDSLLNLGNLFQVSVMYKVENLEEFFVDQFLASQR